MIRISTDCLENKCFAFKLLWLNVYFFLEYCCLVFSNISQGEYARTLNIATDPCVRCIEHGIVLKCIGFYYTLSPPPSTCLNIS